MKLIRVFVSLLFILLFCAGFASAQRLGGAYFGLGTANTTATDDPGVRDAISPDTPPSMSGVFSNFGFGIMLKPKFGFGMNVAWRWSQGEFARSYGLKYRPIFYDFNGIWEPAGSDGRVVPELQGGVGGVNFKLYQSTSSPLLGNANYPVSSRNFFQLHAGAAVRIYLNEGGNWFIRPAFDYHWVRNLSPDPFGRDSVIQGTVAVGYTFGQP